MKNNELFPEYWYELSNENHFWFKWRFYVFKELLKKTKVPLNKSLTVLDLGCGKKIVMEQLKTITDWKIYGEDKLVYKKTKQTAKLKTLKKFDIIVLFDVLEHIKDTKDFVDNLLKRLKKDGILFVNVPAIQLLYSNYDKALGHYRRYNKKKLTNEFSQFKIKSIYVYYWGLLLIPVLVLRKILLINKIESNEIINIGFNPNNKIINCLLKILMSVELFLTKFSPIGSSLIMALQKK